MYFIEKRTNKLYHVPTQIGLLKLQYGEYIELSILKSTIYLFENIGFTYDKISVSDNDCNALISKIILVDSYLTYIDTFTMIRTNEDSYTVIQNETRRNIIIQTSECLPQIILILRINKFSNIDTINYSLQHMRLNINKINNNVKYLCKQYNKILNHNNENDISKLIIQCKIHGKLLRLQHISF